MPTAAREYIDIIFDNRRWADFQPRPDDIFVCTPPKCGTTWTQTIVTELLFPCGPTPGPVFEVAPWIDARFEPIDVVLDRLEAQTHRRHIKTHTPADGVPMFDDAKYIVVGRDGRDACMSFLNHMANLQPELMHRLITSAIEEALPLPPGGPPPTHDVHAYFDWWMNRRFFFDHMSTWWEHHGEPNVLFVHFNDLQTDLDGQMRRIAGFLDIPVDETAWPTQVARCTFAGMKERPHEIADFEDHFVGGADTFLYKGTNGRWQGELTADELARYDAMVVEAFTPECAAWLSGTPAG
ncbi:MAG: sulfotransferase domain-containing protein [Acidimicrobiia bacterium]